MIHCVLICLLTTFSSHSLTVHISGVTSENGQLRIGLFNDAAHFPKEGYIYEAAVIEARGKKYTYTFHDLPAGDYSIAIYHDENNDGKCNKNWMGVPKEAYGFSNNIRPIFSAPTFDKASFSIPQTRSLEVKIAR